MKDRGIDTKQSLIGLATSFPAQEQTVGEQSGRNTGININNDP